MAKKNSVKNTGNIGFEEQLWKAAEILWGNLAPSAYQNVVLGLVFLKYISDRFDVKYQALLAEGEGFEEDIDEYVADGIFFVPEIFQKIIQILIMISCALVKSCFSFPIS